MVLLSLPDSSERFGPVLRSLPHQWFGDPESTYAAVSPTASIKHYRSLVAQRDYYHFVAHLPIQRAHLMGFASSDVEFCVESCAAVHLGVCFAGSRRVHTPFGQVAATTGSAFLLPPGDREAAGASSNAIVTLSPREIGRAASAMAGVCEGPGRGGRRWQAFKPRVCGAGPWAQQIHALVHYIDACAAVDPALPTKLALDDVLYRQAAALLEPTLLEEAPQDGERLGIREGKSAFDDLIDYIRDNLDQPLSLSDLEARSHYSRRALQYAFRQKLHCTPKQWIRQQRLLAAMESLQAADGPLAVQAVALSCGYRSSSAFSRDFKRLFGLSPAQVRRRSL